MISTHARQFKRIFGQAMVDRIASMNEAKALTHDQVDSFMINSLIVNLKAHLEAGNIETFIYKLNISDVSLFFTEQEKAAVISECQNFLNEIGV